MANTSSLCCVICSENYKSSDEILCTNCGHVFHSSCFQDWQNRSRTCPDCRATNPQTQRIYLHIENPTDAERRILERSEELINKLSLLERQLEESENNFFDVQQALVLSEEEVNELKNQLEFKNALNDSYEQELTQMKQALDESEKNFMNILEQLKNSENELNKRNTVIDFLKLQNEAKEKKISDLSSKNEVSKDESQQIHELLQNKLKISEDQVEKLNQDMTQLKIENERIENHLKTNKCETEYIPEEIIKRLEEKLKLISLELDKEIRHTTSLTVENMKLKSIISLPLESNEHKQRIAIECEERRKKNDSTEIVSYTNDLINF